MPPKSTVSAKPAPKNVKTTTKEARAPKEVKEKKEKGEVSGNMLESLRALKGGKAMTHSAVAAITGKDKGNKLRELTDGGYIETSEQEGVKGNVYTITRKGLDALKNAPK